MDLARCIHEQTGDRLLTLAGGTAQIAALVAAYGAGPGDGISEFTDERPMIENPGPICGRAAVTR